MTNSEKACTVFDEGFNCAQAVFSAYAEQLGLDREVALKIAGAFGGGMARRGDTCGAVTGALMVIGLKHGKAEKKDDSAREKTYKLTNEFAARFRALHGSLMCRELINCDISTPEGLKRAQDGKIFKTVCPKF